MYVKNVYEIEGFFRENDECEKETFLQFPKIFLLRKILSAQIYFCIFRKMLLFYFNIFRVHFLYLQHSFIKTKHIHTKLTVRALWLDTKYKYKMRIYTKCKTNREHRKQISTRRT